LTISSTFSTIIGIIVNICTRPCSIKWTTRREGVVTWEVHLSAVVTTSATVRLLCKVSATAWSCVGRSTAEFGDRTDRTTTAIGDKIDDIVTAGVATIRDGVVESKRGTVNTQTTIVNIGRGVNADVHSCVEHRTTTIIGVTRITTEAARVRTKGGTVTSTTSIRGHRTDVTTTATRGQVAISVLTIKTRTVITTSLKTNGTLVTTVATVVIIDNISNTIGTVVRRDFGNVSDRGTANRSGAKRGTVVRRTTTTCQLIIPLNTDTITTMER